MNTIALVVVTLIYAAVSAFGLYLIKDASALLSTRAFAGLALYGSGFCIWIVMLRYFPLSVAFPVAAGSLIIATHLVARFYLAETVTVAQTAGMAVIVAGMFLVFLRTQ